MATVTGTGAGTLRFYGSAIGELKRVITGAGAGALSFFGGSVPANVVFRYTSRAVFPDNSKCQFFEFVAADIKCKFDDTLAFNVTGKTDEKRDKATMDYATTHTTINNKTVSGQPQYRNFISAIFPPGVDGNFVQVELDKTVHHLNGFDFNGLNEYVAPRQGMSAEFVTGSTVLLSGWD